MATTSTTLLPGRLFPLLPDGLRLPAVRPGHRRLFLLVLAALCLLAVAGGIFLQSLPDVGDPAAWLPPQSIVLRDRNGLELYRLSRGQDRTVLAAEEMPALLRGAFVAIEDERFFRRGCVDVRALGRALLANLRRLKSQGGSTITQQLVRTAFLTPEKRWSRKLKEIMLACRTERAMEKEEILTLYLNWIPFGKDIYGVRQASQRFFGVEPQRLSVAQAAVLASLPQRPSYFSPYGAHRVTEPVPSLLDRIRVGDIRTEADITEEDVTIGLLPQLLTMSGTTLLLGGRSSQVLVKMEERGVIDRAERQAAEAELLGLRFASAGTALRAPYFSLAAVDRLPEIIPGDLPRRGLDVVTTVDLPLQTEVERLVSARAEDTFRRFHARDVAVVVADVRTREIVSYVGNWDYFGSGDTLRIDMATEPRQPGSSFKPIVYAAAFSRGLRPTDLLPDTPISINGDRPQNYEGGFQGPLLALQALPRSRNIPAIRAYQRTSEQEILDLAARMGAVSPLRQKQSWQYSGRPADYGWPIALGAAEVSLLEMVRAYAALASGGVSAPLRTLRKVTDPDGRILLPSAPAAERVLDQGIADTLTAILSEPGLRPAGYWRNQMNVPGLDAAVKTGTSNLCLKRDRWGRCTQRLPGDTWAIGYSPEYVVGVWVGNADRTPLTAKADGLNAAIPLWRDVLLAAHKRAGKTESRFTDARAPWLKQHPLPAPRPEERPYLELAGARRAVVRRGPFGE